MRIKAVSISEIDFSPYGVYYDMKNNPEIVLHSKGEGWEDHMTKTPILDTPAHLGYTLGEKAPYEIKKMEKHSHTKEAMFCASEPVVVALAKNGNGRAPKAENIVAVILHPGDMIVINRNVWHDACHGINKQSYYYYIATAGKQPAEWIDIEGERVIVEV